MTYSTLSDIKVLHHAIFFLKLRIGVEWRHPSNKARISTKKSKIKKKIVKV